VSTRRWQQCPFNLACVIVGETQFGKWHVQFGEVVETQIDTDKSDPDTQRISIEKVNPLVYCATVREYWTVGERLGHGFCAGRVLEIPDIISERE
jgi:flavin reductase (DIM6/NTAB) family NADH-FMN oxidoreductase RutF